MWKRVLQSINKTITFGQIIAEQYGKTHKHIIGGDEDDDDDDENVEEKYINWNKFRKKTIEIANKTEQCLAPKANTTDAKRERERDGEQRQQKIEIYGNATKAESIHSTHTRFAWKRGRGKGIERARDRLIQQRYTECGSQDMHTKTQQAHWLGDRKKKDKASSSCRFIIEWCSQFIRVVCLFVFSNFFSLSMLRSFVFSFEVFWTVVGRANIRYSWVVSLQNYYQYFLSVFPAGRAPHWCVCA